MSEDPPLNPELLMSDKEWKELREKMLTRVPTMKEFEELKRSLNEWVPWMEDRVTKLEEENKRLKEENERQNWKMTKCEKLVVFLVLLIIFILEVSFLLPFYSPIIILAFLPYPLVVAIFLFVDDDTSPKEKKRKRR